MVFFALLSITLLVVDYRFRYLEVVRQTVAVATYPLQQLTYTPTALVMELGSHFHGIDSLRAENARLQKREAEAGVVALRQEQLDRENQQLRALLDMRQRQPVKGVAAEILYNVRDPFSHKVLVDKGSQHNIQAGQAVVDGTGVIGQVTRIYPFQSEVTLVTHKNQGVPVLVARTGLRSVVFGTGDGQLELRFIAANADIQEGDVLETSGLDDVYVPGLPIAKVIAIRRDAAYARVLCAPLAGVEHNDLVLILSKPNKAGPPPPDPEPAKASKKRKAA